MNTQKNKFIKKLQKKTVLSDYNTGKGTITLIEKFKLHSLYLTNKQWILFPFFELDTGFRF